MKTITLEEAHQILDECFAVVIDRDVLVYPRLSDLEHSNKNEFLYISRGASQLISWGDEYRIYSLSHSVRFAEGENQSVKVSGNSMFLVDTNGDECQLTILEPKQLE
jgi:hypothetical protein